MMRSIGALFASLLGVVTAVCGAASQPTAERTVVGKSLAPVGAVACRAVDKTAFDLLPVDADVFAGDLLIPLPGAVLRNKAGTVELTSRADFEGKSPYPILETAVVIHDTPDVDLDFTLDRGRVDLANRKPNGAATVKVRFHQWAWRLTLEGPGTRVALEIYGRWLPGTPILKNANDAPTASVVAVVLAGEVELANGQTALRLTAPPGPSMVQWTSTEGQFPSALKLDKLPEWADPAAKPGPTGNTMREALEKFRRLRAEQPGKAIDAFLASDNAVEQRIALVALGAEDDLARLGQTIAAARSLEMWDFGMSVVRHWIGRGPGQDRKLLDALVSLRGFTPTQAETILRMLHGFGAEDAKKPETYEVLIEYLLHDKAAIRNLAAWHLVRLAPAGKDIAFRPNASKAEFQSLYSRWKELIPAGRLPPAR
jgi:hypothetical protein